MTAKQKKEKRRASTFVSEYVFACCSILSNVRQARQTLHSSVMPSAVFHSAGSAKWARQIQIIDIF